MKRLVLISVAGAVLVIAAVLVNRRGIFYEDPTLPRGKGALALPGAASNVTAPDPESPQNHLARVSSEILPLAEDFLRKLEPLSPAGVILPLHLPLASHEVRQAQFAGGPSNLVCTFDLGGHSFFGCHIVNRDGRQTRGVNLFRRKGPDEHGLPRNIIQLTEDPAANEPHLRALADINLYPARALPEVAALAQRVLNALRPEVAAGYRLAESWQEQAGVYRLPFYMFAFVKSGPPGTDPSNLMRDEIMIGLKSTDKGLVLDSFEDNSIAFLGQVPPSGAARRTP
jgi:hypothetical protein